MIQVIMGRTCSGKDTLMREMEKIGMTRARTFTTRPRRGEKDDGYVFLTQEQADAVPKKDRILATTINGYDYFTTALAVDSANFICLDPYGLEEIIHAFPEISFEVLCLAADRSCREKRAMARGDGDAFAARDAAENERFSDFEHRLQHDGMPESHALSCVRTWRNDRAGLESYANIARRMAQEQLRHNAYVDFIANAAVSGFIPTDNDGLLRVDLDDGHGHLDTEIFSADQAASGVEWGDNFAASLLRIMAIRRFEQSL